MQLFSRNLTAAEFVITALMDNETSVSSEVSPPMAVLDERRSLPPPTSPTTTEDPDEPCHLYSFVVCVVIIGVVCLFGLAGNVLSFLVLCKHKTENAAIFLLQCMAVFDFLLLVVTLFIYTFPAVYPYTGYLLVMHTSYELIILNIWPIGTMLHTATIWLTVLVTINRYNAVCRAIEEFGATSLRSTKIQVAVVILFSILYNAPRFFEHRAMPGFFQRNSANSTTTNRTSLSSLSSSSSSSYNDDLLQQTVGPPIEEEEEEVLLGDNRIYQIIYANLLYYPVMYILPLASLAYLNFKLITSLKTFKQKALKTSTRRAKEDNITNCVIAIVCVFIVTQTPALLNQIFWATFSNDDRDCGRFHFYYTKFSDLLVVVNSSCNFVVYCMFGRTFRRIFLDTVCCCGGPGGPGGSGASRVGEPAAKTRYTHVDQVPLGRLPPSTDNGATAAGRSNPIGRL